MAEYITPNLKNSCRIVSFLGIVARALARLEIFRAMSLPRQIATRIMEMLSCKDLARKNDCKYSIGATLANLGNPSLAQIADALVYFEDGKAALLAIISMAVLFVGTFMDMLPAALIFTPTFLPAAQSLCISDIHFGIVAITNLSIGLCTPPVGACLFVGCGVAGAGIAGVALRLAGYVPAMIAAIMLISFVAELYVWLPELFGIRSDFILTLATGIF